MIVALLMIKIVLVVEKALLCSRWARVLVLEGWIFLLGGCDHDGGIVDVLYKDILQFPKNQKFDSVSQGC